MTTKTAKLSGKTDLRFNRYDNYGNAIFQITPEYAHDLNQKAIEMGCTILPAKEFNDRWTIKQKCTNKIYTNQIVMGVVSVKHWKYGNKSGLSTTISDFIEDQSLNRYRDVPPFGWECQEL